MNQTKGSDMTILKFVAEVDKYLDETYPQDKSDYTARNITKGSKPYNEKLAKAARRYAKWLEQHEPNKRR